MIITRTVNELINGDISHVSIVAAGANKSPFKVLKSEDIPRTTLKDRLKEAVTKTELTTVRAIICTTENVDLAKKVLADCDLSADNVEEVREGLHVFKQEGYDPNAEVSLVALNEQVLVVTDVCKYFDSYPASADFTENLVAGSFYPGMSTALNSLGETVYNIMWDADDSATAIEKVSSAADAFRDHLIGLVSNLPTTVFKMDVKGFNDEEVQMQTLEQRLIKAKTDPLTAVGAGDLDALGPEPVVKAVADPVEEPVVEEPVVEPVEPVAKTEGEDEPVVDGEEEIVAKGDEPVVEEPVVDGDPAAEPQDSNLLVAKAISGLTEVVKTLQETIVKQGEEQEKRISDVVKTASDALEKAEAPVVNNFNAVSEPIATLHSHKRIGKHDASAPEDIWKGTMGEIDGMVAGSRDS